MTPMDTVDAHPAGLTRLLESLGSHAELAIAVSGGMDSLVLALIAHRNHPHVAIFHAASAAVPEDATARSLRLAEKEGWRFSVIDAGEQRSPDYVRNPVDRCYHCKSHLYAAIRGHTGAVIASGNNLSDLGDYRPGLIAAAEKRCVHPYIQAGIDKNGIRALAGWFGWSDLRDMPPSPCLASRIETGIAITEGTLLSIGRIEVMVRERLQCETVRCRVRGGGISIELDPIALTALTPELNAEIKRAVVAVMHGSADVAFTAYRRGSAFLR